jgi:hypothetical protein
MICLDNFTNIVIANNIKVLIKSTRRFFLRQHSITQLDEEHKRLSSKIIMKTLDISWEMNY